MRRSYYVDGDITLEGSGVHTRLLTNPQTIKLVGITALRTVNPAQLSSGQLQTIKAVCSADIVRAAKTLYGWQISLQAVAMEGKINTDRSRSVR